MATVPGVDTPGCSNPALSGRDGPAKSRFRARLSSSSREPGIAPRLLAVRAPFRQTSLPQVCRAAASLACASRQDKAASTSSCQRADSRRHTAHRPERPGFDEPGVSTPGSAISRHPQAPKGRPAGGEGVLHKLVAGGGAHRHGVRSRDVSQPRGDERPWHTPKLLTLVKRSVTTKSDLKGSPPVRGYGCGL